MKTNRVEHDVTLSPAYLRQQLKECEAKAKRIREALQATERAVRLTRLLGQPANNAQTARKDEAAKIVPMRAAAPRLLRDEIRALKPTMPRLNAIQVLERLSKFPFTSDPKKAISDALYQLRKQGELRIVSHGKGGTPNTFEWAQSPIKSA
jgi:hypothetical protein